MRILAPLLLVVACTSGLRSRPLPAAETVAPDTEPPADTDGPADTAEPDTGEPSDTVGACPAGMALVEDALCVDRFEAALEEWDGSAWGPASPYDTVDGRTVRAVPADGRIPQGYVSGDEAAAACAAAGKRLCSSEEWLAACRGPHQRLYPYGEVHQDGACNDEYVGTHPVVDYFGTGTGIWDPAHMNDPGINQQPGTVAAGGSFGACATAEGVHDLHGNLHEWVADAEGTFRGGFYADAAINGAGCTYATTAHTRTYHDYSTGFRCCSDPAARRR